MEKKGVSLIVLVVTIIIMIILATVIILSLNQSEIIEKSEFAVDLTNKKTAEEKVNLAISQYLLDNNGNATDAQLQTVVNTALASSSFSGTVANGKVVVTKKDELSEPGSDLIIKIEIGEAEAGQAISIPVMATEVANALGTSYSDVTFNFTVDYGDGEPSTTVTEELTSDTMLTHTYNTAGEYTLTFSGSSVPFIYLNYVDDGEYIPGPDSFETVKVNEIVSWGDVGLKVVAFNGEHDFSTFPKPYSSSFKDLEMMTWIDPDASSHNKISSIPAGLFKDATKLKSVSNLFAYSTITSIPTDMFYNCTSLQDASQLFDHCENLTTVPENLFTSCTGIKNLYGCFYGCHSLESIPAGLLTGLSSIENLNYMFAACSSLTGDAPAWWAIYGEGPEIGDSCFGGSSGLSNYSSIPYYWIRYYK